MTVTSMDLGQQRATGYDGRGPQLFLKQARVRGWAEAPAVTDRRCCWTDGRNRHPRWGCGGGRGLKCSQGRVGL